jgi:hypothetical protein
LGLSYLAVILASSLALPLTVTAAPATCTWTGNGDGTHWSSSLNWSGCSGAPANGDSLVFNASILSDDALLNNDMSGLQLGSLTFTGNGPNFYAINGNSFSLSGGISNTTIGAAALINNSGITLTADQTFSSTGLLDIESIALDTGAYNLTLDGVGTVDIFSEVTGTGTLQTNASRAFLDNDNPNFSGPIHITDGTLIINAVNPIALGTGSVTIEDGATLQESINNNGTYSISNPITMVGNGNGFWSAGALVVYGFSANGTVNFTGPITLTGDATVGVTSASVNIAGTVSGCGYTITEASGTSDPLSGNLTGSCPIPTSSSGSSSQSSGGSSATAPSTGYGTPPQFQPIVLLLGISAIISMGIGTSILYRQKSQAH